MNKHPGDPSGKTPERVDQDPSYAFEVSRRASTWPEAVEHVVFHKPTKTWWRCIYRVYNDHSYYDHETKWRQVAPRRVTGVVYDEVTS